MRAFFFGKVATMTLRPLALALALSMLVPLSAAADPGFASLPMQEAVSVMQQEQPPLIVDVREPAEYAAGHVPGAINVPLGTVGTWGEGRPKDEPLLIICQSGRRSLKASQELAARGFTRVTNVEGGFRAWKERGLPVAHPAPLDAESAER